MTYIVCRPDKDKPPKKDATKAFLPEAELVVDALELAYRVDVVTLSGDPEVLFAAIRATTRLDGLVYLGHGFWNKLTSAGLVGIPAAHKLARVVATRATPKLITTFFACSAADGPKKGVSLDGPGTDGGFCDEYRDELCRAGIVDSVTYGHPTFGHASKNPFLAVFEGRGSPIGGQGGYALVRASGRSWKVWKALMADSSGKVSLRHRVPMMSPAEALSELASNL